MAEITVDFDVFKEITARRTNEAVTENDVLRDMFGLNGKGKTKPSQPEQAKGLTFKGVHFPEGTQFRATYKGKTYTAEIKDGGWINSDGSRSTSPSEAAVRITGKPWNGWHFWHCKRPSDHTFKLINALRS